MEDKILIFGGNKTVYRSDDINKASIPVEQFQQEVQQFYNSISASLTNLSDNNSEFKLTEITINAEVSATGKIGLLGFGAEAGMKGSLSFKLTRS